MFFYWIFLISYAAWSARLFLCRAFFTYYNSASPMFRQILPKKIKYIILELYT